MLLLTLALLLLPAAYHRIVNKGNDTPALHRVTTRVVEIALFPFALAFAISLYLATEKIAGWSIAIVTALLALFISLFFWYGIEWLERAKHQTQEEAKLPANQLSQEEKLENKMTGAGTLAAVITGVSVILFFGLWFGVPLYVKAREKESF